MIFGRQQVAARALAARQSVALGCLAQQRLSQHTHEVPFADTARTVQQKRVRNPLACRSELLPEGVLPRQRGQPFHRAISSVSCPRITSGDAVLSTTKNRFAYAAARSR